MTDNFAVVGTDTGVGKTVVTAGLVGMLRADGVDAQAIKPCQTGYPSDDDAGFVTEACGTDAAATCLRRLEPPLAPEIAADREGVVLSYAELLSGCEQALVEVERGIVEGIGGLRVPLTEGQVVIDLVADLDLPAVVVARSGLGTLNHTALTVEALRRREIAVLGIILNEYEGATAAERTNPAMIERMTDLSVQTFPSIDLSNPTAVVRGAIEHLPRSLIEDTE
jgi:dethiobiotin synthetase